LSTISAETVIFLIELKPLSAAEKNIEVIIMTAGGYLTLRFIPAIYKNRRVEQ
jgi:hypothetical protein